MTKFRITVVFAALFSMAVGFALYNIIQHTASDTPGTADGITQGVVQTNRNNSSDATVKPFHFKTYSKPKTLPAITFVSGAGKPLGLKAFRGKLILLNIWATWCGPCREEMPALDRLQARLGGDNFQVIPLSIDREGVEAVKGFYQELGLESLEIYIDAEMSASTRLNVLGIPTTLLINADGQELSRVLGPAVWDSAEMIEEIQRFMKPVVNKGG